MSGTRWIHVTGLALAIMAGLLATSWWTRASVAPVTRDALAASFDAGIRNLVIEWDVNDERPELRRWLRVAAFEARIVLVMLGSTPSFQYPCLSANGASA
jgi:hypothetical protein